MPKEILNVWEKEPFTQGDAKKYSPVTTTAQGFTLMERKISDKGLLSSRLLTVQREVLGDYSYHRLETQDDTGFWNSQVGDFLKDVWARRVRHAS